MIPLFFGNSAAPVYGVLHPSSQGGTPKASAVLCAPIGHEYLQSHRVMRNLSTELAGRGVSVLRFDYTGTGDSSGDGDAMTLASMTDDVEMAIAEVQGLTRSRKVVLVSLRAGAFPVVRAAVNPSVIGCALWEPVLRGMTVLPTLRESTERVSLSLGGFPYGAALQQELETFDAAAEWVSSSRRLWILSPSEDEHAALRSVAPQLQWTRTSEALDFGAPGCQDLLRIAEHRLIEFADAVESLASS